MWWFFAILSALFAGLVPILAKLGFGKGDAAISSNLATAVRMLLVFPLAWAVVFVEGSWPQLKTLRGNQWGMLLLSGAATGLSWLFYFAAISRGDVSRIAPIDKSSIAITFILAILVLHEPMRWQSAVATVLVLVALAVTLIPSRPASLSMGSASTAPTTTQSLDGPQK
jgi:transporter family protein